MKTILSLAIILFMSLPSFGQSMDYSPKNAYMVKSFSGEKINNLEVNTSGGHIKVIGGAKTVEVEVYARRNNSFLSSSESLGSWDVDIDTRGTLLKVSAQKREKTRDENISISFVVYVPDEMNTDLRTSGGHIEMSDLQGAQKFRTSGGHISLTDVNGTMEGRTSGGHLNVASCQGKIELRTSGGHIDISDSEGIIKVETSGGHIKLKNISGELMAETSGGNIDASFKTVNSGIDLSTSGGNITAELPQADYDLDLDGSFVNAKLKDFDGYMEKDRVRGKVGKGGSRVRMETSGGFVNVRFLD